MKKYIQKILDSFNILLNTIIAISISIIVIVSFEILNLNSIFSKNFSMLSMVIGLLVLGKYLLYIYKSSDQKINFVDYMTINSVIYSTIMITYLTLEKNSFDINFFFIRGVHIIIFILNIFVLFARVNVVKNIESKDKIIETAPEKSEIKEQNPQNHQKSSKKGPQNVALEPLKEVLVEEVPVSKNNLLTEGLEIDETLYNEYTAIISSFGEENNIDFNLTSLRNKNIYSSILVNIKSNDDLLSLLMKIKNELLFKTSLGLNAAEVLALNFLFTIYPSLRTEINSNKDYYLVNQSNTYLGRLKFIQTNSFEIDRRKYFDKLFETFPGTKDILQSIYQEINDYINNKVQKKIQKIEFGRADDQAFFDLYLDIYSFDHLKARRQVTKFIEEYNQSQTPGEYSKKYKEFIDGVFKTDYAPTIFPYLSTLTTRINNKSKLILDITKKTIFFQNKEQIALNNQNKAIFSLVMLFNELSEHESVKTLKQLYAKNDDLLFQDALLTALITYFGYNHYLVKGSEELLKANTIKFVNDNPNYFESKDFSTEVMKVVHNYLKTEDIFQSFITNNINIETINTITMSFAITTKVKNTNHYYLDLRSLTTYIPKSEIIKLMKQKEESNKQNLLIELVRNREIDTRLSLDPKRF